MMLRLREDVPSFERILIETTGLADPAPILHTLMSDQLVTNYFRLDGVIATVDAVNGEDTLDKQFESVKQAAVADRILITKTDLVDDKVVASLKRGWIPSIQRPAPAGDQWRGGTGGAVQCRAIQPGRQGTWMWSAGCRTRPMPMRRGTITHTAMPTITVMITTTDHDHAHAHDVNRHDDLISSFCVTYDEPLRLDALEQWLDTIAMLKGPDLLRIKGIVNVAEMDKPVVIHGVQHVFHPPAVLTPGRPRIVDPYRLHYPRCRAGDD